jgi:hypothetical protein
VVEAASVSNGFNAVGPAARCRLAGSDTRAVRGQVGPSAPSRLTLILSSPSNAAATYMHRKTLPIKRADAEMLTREDIQFDLLHHIFSNPVKAFEDQAPAYGSAAKASGKVTFGELYTNILSHSFKLSKVIKDKMVETPAFATEFAKFAFLTNVGRINTTMACANSP